MARSPLLYLLASLLSSVPAETVDIQTAHDGLLRDCRIYLPQSALDDPGRPRHLVLVLHWLHGDGVQTDEAWGAGFRQVAEDRAYVIFYPSAIDGAWNAQAEVAPQLQTADPVDDVGYLTSLMDFAAETYGTDPGRVFVTGASNGAYMTYRLSRERSDRIAACAPMLASLPRLVTSGDIAMTPTLYLAGTEDPLIPYDGGPALYSARQSLSLFAEAFGLVDSYTTERLPDTSAEDGTTTDRLVFAGSRPGVALVHYRINGGGHMVPGHDLAQVWRDLYGLGRATLDYDGPEHIGRFFAAYGRPPDARAISIGSGDAEQGFTLSTPLAAPTGSSVGTATRFDGLDPAIDHRLVPIPDGSQ